MTMANVKEIVASMRATILSPSSLYLRGTSSMLSDPRWVGLTPEERRVVVDQVFGSIQNYLAWASVVAENLIGLSSRSEKENVMRPIIAHNVAADGNYLTTKQGILETVKNMRAVVDLFSQGVKQMALEIKEPVFHVQYWTGIKAAVINAVEAKGTPTACAAILRAYQMDFCELRNSLMKANPGMVSLAMVSIGGEGYYPEAEMEAFNSILKTIEEYADGLKH